MAYMYPVQGFAKTVSVIKFLSRIQSINRMDCAALAIFRLSQTLLTDNVVAHFQAHAAAVKDVLLHHLAAAFSSPARKNPSIRRYSSTGLSPGKISASALGRRNTAA